MPRGSIEDATVTPDLNTLATMEGCTQAELRRVPDKYEVEMATFKRFANDREGETAQAVLDAMQHILEESNRRIDELEAELARARLRGGAEGGDDGAIAPLSASARWGRA